jgi:hypothetical protein
MVEPRYWLIYPDERQAILDAAHIASNLESAARVAENKSLRSEMARRWEAHLTEATLLWRNRNGSPQVDFNAGNHP